MKKRTTPSRNPRPIVELATDSLKQVTGGGISGPDICEGRYKIRCIQDYIPPSSQDC